MWVWLPPACLRLLHLLLSIPLSASGPTLPTAPLAHCRPMHSNSARSPSFCTPSTHIFFFLNPAMQAVAFKLRIPQRKPWQSMADDVAVAVALAADQQRMMAGVLPAGQEEAQQLIDDVQVILARWAGGRLARRWAGCRLADGCAPTATTSAALTTYGSVPSGSQTLFFLCPFAAPRLLLQAEPGN